MQSEEEMFMASLICNLDVDCEKLLVCKPDLDCIKTLHFDTEIIWIKKPFHILDSYNYELIISILKVGLLTILQVNSSLRKCYSWPQEYALNGSTSGASATYFQGKSPFPALDAFVESVATIGNVSGKIRSCWYWLSEFARMVYSMSRNRYRERIGRQHKSNHVIYVADLRRAAYYQKCHDPDCRGYRSPSRPIPWEIIPDMVHEHKNDPESVSYGDENMTSGCVTDSWWLEAIRVADDVENKQNSLGISNMEDIDSDDENWWMAVERTASQAEFMHVKLFVRIVVDP